MVNEDQFLAKQIAVKCGSTNKMLWLSQITMTSIPFVRVFRVSLS